MAVGWALDRSEVLRQLAAGEDRRAKRGVPPIWLYYWLRFVIPAAILAVGAWWLLTDVLEVAIGSPDRNTRFLQKLGRYTYAAREGIAVVPRRLPKRGGSADDQVREIHAR